MATSITDAIDFANFDAQGDTHGSGVDTSDTFNNWRRKTNGIINELNKITPFAKTKISWAAGPTFSQYANSYNIDTVTYVTQADDEGAAITGPHKDGGLRVRFTTPHPTGDYLVFAQMNRTGGAQTYGVIVPAATWSRSQDISTFNQTTAGLTISMMGKTHYLPNDRIPRPDASRSFFTLARDSTSYDSLSLLVFS